MERVLWRFVSAIFRIKIQDKKYGMRKKVEQELYIIIETVKKKQISIIIYAMRTACDYNCTK